MCLWCPCELRSLESAEESVGFPRVGVRDSQELGNVHTERLAMDPRQEQYVLSNAEFYSPAVWTAEQWFKMWEME